MPLYTSYSEETQTLIEEFLENTFGWDEDELVGFIEIYGENKFQSYTRLRVCINVFLFIFCVEERLQSHGYILSMR